MATSFTGRVVKNSYQEVVKIDNTGAGFDTTLRSIADGSGTASQLKLSTTKISLNGQLWPSSLGSNGQFLTTDASGNLSWATISTGGSTLSSLTDVTVTEGSSIDKYMLRFDNTSGKWIADKRIVQICLFAQGTMTNSEVLLVYTPAATLTLPAGLTNSVAALKTATTNALTLTILKNGSSIGTINFTAGSTSGTFTFTNAVTLTAATDTLEIDGPATADTTAANLHVSFYATY
jgi:hypothetical protein